MKQTGDIKNDGTLEVALGAGSQIDELSKLPSQPETQDSLADTSKENYVRKKLSQCIDFLSKQLDKLSLCIDSLMYVDNMTDVCRLRSSDANI